QSVKNFRAMFSISGRPSRAPEIAPIRRLDSRAHLLARARKGLSFWIAALTSAVPAVALRRLNQGTWGPPTGGPHVVLARPQSSRSDPSGTASSPGALRHRRVHYWLRHTAPVSSAPVKHGKDFITPMIRDLQSYPVDPRTVSHKRLATHSHGTFIPSKIDTACPEVQVLSVSDQRVRVENLLDRGRSSQNRRQQDVAEERGDAWQGACPSG